MSPNWRFPFSGAMPVPEIKPDKTKIEPVKRFNMRCACNEVQIAFNKTPKIHSGITK